MSGELYECGSCGHATDGYSKRDLEAKGWVWHKLKGGIRSFVLCDVCVALYKRRREAKEKAAA